MTYQVPPVPPEPKPQMVDCTDRQDIIEACKSGDRKAPRGGWKGGRFLVYADSLKDWRGEHRKIEV